jgi:hypothetical protein
MELSLRKLLRCFKALGAAKRNVARHVPRPNKNKRRLSLTVEALEDRTVPTVVPTWPGGHQPIQHPGALSLSITGVPSQIKAGTSFAVSVTEYNANTGAVSSNTGSVALTENIGGYYGTARSLGSVTLTAGRGTAVVTPVVAGNADIIADAGPVNYNSLELWTWSSLVVIPGPAVSVGVSAPTTMYQGVPAAVSFTAKDAYGNTATSYNQTISLSASDHEVVTPQAVPLASGTGSASVILRNAGTITVTAGAGAVTGTATITVVSPISALSTTVGYAPGYSSQYLQTGSEVDITGRDFQPGAKVIFGNPGTADPQQLWQLANKAGVGATPSINGSGTWLSVNVPRYAVNGPIEVIDPDGTCLVSAQSFTVNNYRNTFAFSFQNFTFNITWDDMKGEFGGSQVDICVPNPWGSGDTGVPSPVALGVWGIAAAALNGKGACFGMDLTSVLMNEYNPSWINAGNGLPANRAATVFNLQQNDALTNMIRQKHLAQISQQVIGNFLSWEASSHSAASVYSQISSLLSAGHHPIISLEAGANHAVVAYGLEPGPNGNGDYYIDVYDPNRPFNGVTSGLGLDPTEYIDLANHVKIEQSSRIYVDTAGNWSFTMADGSAHGGSVGRLGSLQVAPVDLVSGGATFPGNFTEIVAGGALSVIFASEASSAHAPAAQGNTPASLAFPGFRSLSEAELSLHSQAETSLKLAPTRSNTLAHAAQASSDAFDHLGWDDGLSELLAGSAKNTSH